MVKYLILFLIPITAQSEPLTVNEWVSKYNRPCSEVKKNMVCRESINISLRRMKENKVVQKMLKKSGLPLWLATVPIVESAYLKKSVSKAGAVGIWQLMPFNIQTYHTRKYIIKAPIFSGGAMFYDDIITETKPTIELCRTIGHNVKASTVVAIWLLRRLYDKYKNWELALMAYNAGEPRINDYLQGKGKPLKDETLNYYTQIMAIQQFIKEM